MGDVTQPAGRSQSSRTQPDEWAAPRALPNACKVSIIVPARNEEVCLANCLHSLITQTIAQTLAQTLPAADRNEILENIEGIEIIVVDDGSTDQSRAIAEAFAQQHPNLRVISSPPLPEHWIGKNNAVIAGADAAHGEWLLFTDADTFHHPGSLARALAEATQQNAALLSYSPEQEVYGFWEQAVMPVVFAELAATYSMSDVSDPASAAAAANGQYLLIRRDVYDAVGGHRAVATELLEDVALARRVKQAGHRIQFRYAPDAVRTRMYRCFAQLKEGWIKNLALLFPDANGLANRRIAEFGAIAGGSIAAFGFAGLGSSFGAYFAGGLAAFAYIRFLLRIRRAHFSWRGNVLSIFGLPIFVHLLRRSAIQWKGSGVTWKGRRYVRPASAG